MILLDSSFIIALYNTRDQHHKKAEELMENICDKEFGDAYVSDYIFDEVATGMLKNIGIAETSKICNVLLNGTYLIYIDENLFKKSFEMFKRQKNTTLSFTDCTTVVLMEHRGIKNLATFDADFKSFHKINVVDA